MAEYKEFVLSIAETVVYVKKLTDEQYAFAVQKNQEDLLDIINEVVAEYKGDKVDELITKHMGA